LATRKLLAELDMSMEEENADHSTFESDLKVPAAVDLSTAEFSSKGLVTLDQCAFKGNGIKAKDLVDTGGCDFLKSLGASAKMIGMCMQAAKEHEYQGYVGGLAQKDATTETFNKNTRGVIGSITCTVDSPNSDDTSMLNCKNLQLLSIQLDLVNTADLVADEFTPPKDPRSDATPQGQKPDPKRSSAIKARLGSHARAKPNVTCKAGLTNIGGSCVPALKR
jgi:hypothetical protein